MDAFEILNQHAGADGFHRAVARFWKSADDQAAGRPAPLVNDFRLQLRPDHQRIRRGPRGGLLHVSGAEVAAVDVAAFLRSETAVEWIRDDRGRVLTDDAGRWRRRRGAALAPFLFAGAADPQWVRERYSVAPPALLVQELRAFGARAAAHGWRGDLRGTTTVYQVGASADDGDIDSGSNWDDTGLWVNVGKKPITELSAKGWYRFAAVTGVGGQTIASAFVSLWGYATDTGTPNTSFSFEMANAPDAPTTAADYNGRSRTTPELQWDNPGLSTSAWTNSPELKTILQQVADAHTPTVLQIFHRDNGSAAGDLASPEAWDSDSAHAPKLTVDNGLVTWHRAPARRRPIYAR